MSAEQQVLELLQQCMGGVGIPHEAQQHAMRQVEACEASESVSGYVNCLIQILQQWSGVPADCRQLAAISLKNVVGKRWVQRAATATATAVGDVEKGALRQYLLNCWLEPDRKVAVQLSVLTAKIAHKDWPANWPELLPSLFQAASAPLPGSGELGLQQQTRAMTALKCVLDELAASPLQQQQLTRVCSEMFSPMVVVWLALVEQLAALSQHMETSLAPAQQQGGIPRNPQYEQLAAHTAVATAVLCFTIQKSFSLLAKQPETVARFFGEVVVRLPGLASFVRAGTRALGDDNDSVDHEGGYEFDPVNSGDPGALSGVKALLPPVRAVVRDCSRLIAKLQKENPLEMVPFLGSFLTLFSGELLAEYSAAGAAGVGADALQPLYVSSVLLLSNTLSCKEYSSAGVASAGEDALHSREVLKAKLAQRIEAESRGLLSSPNGAGVVNAEEIVAAARVAAAQGAAAKAIFFTAESTQGLLDLLLHRLLRLSTAELEEWAMNPEQFVVGQEGLNEGDTVKSASEHLLLALLDASMCPHSEDVATQLVGHLHNLPLQLQAVQAQGGGGEANVLFWDAVFLSTGLGNYTLGDRIDANEWLVGVLAPLMTALLASPMAGSLQDCQQLLRTRLLWLIKCWLYSFDKSMLDKLVALISAMLAPSAGSDVVSSIEGVRLVQAIVDSKMCSPDMLAPVLLQLFESLCALTVRLEDSELRAEIVVVLGDLVQLSGVEGLVPVLQPLSVHLCSLWTAAGTEQQSPVRASIMDCISHMVRTAGAASPALHSVAGPVLVAALSGTDESAYLFKESLALLLAVVRNCPHDGFSESLDALLPAALSITFLGECGVSSAEDMRTAMSVCEAFLALRGPQCLFSSGAIIGQTLGKLLGQVDSKNAIFVVRPIEVMFLSCPADASRFLLSTGQLHVLMRICASSTPQLLYEKSLDRCRQDHDLGLVAYLSVVARVLLCSPELLGPVVTELSGELAQQTRIGLTPEGAMVLEPNALLKAILRLLLDKFDQVGYCTAGMWRRKLWCLALLSLFPHTGMVLEWFPEVCDKVDDVLSEEASEEGAQRKSQFVNALAGNDMDDGGQGDGDDDDDDDGGSSNAEKQEPLMQTFDRLLHADVVITTDVRTMAEAKVAAMRASGYQ